MKQFKVKGLTFLFIALLITSLTGCSTTSSGFGLGMEGSEHWHNRASKAEKTAFWKTRSLNKLESSWDRQSYLGNSSRIREAISTELERRGLDGQMFYDPAADYKRQADARELGQALSAGLQSINQQNQKIQQSTPNVTYRQIGNTTYGSDGTSYRQSGNTTYGSDGTIYRQSGNTTYGSDGTNYRQSGNTIYGSDGTTYRQSGNTIYGSDGTTCRKVGNTTYCN